MEHAAAAAATNSSTTSAVIKQLVKLSRHGHEPCPNSDVLFTALATVSQCYSVPVPSHSAGTIAEALHQVHRLVQQHRLFAEIDPKYQYSSMQKATVEVGLKMLWAHVTTYKLHNALIDVVRTIDSLPRAIAFWKKLRRRQVRATIQEGPIEWFLPRYRRDSGQLLVCLVRRTDFFACISSERITLDEKIRSLEATLEAHLVWLPFFVASCACMHFGLTLHVLWTHVLAGKSGDAEGADVEIHGQIHGL